MATKKKKGLPAMAVIGFALAAGIYGFSCYATHTVVTEWLDSAILGWFGVFLVLAGAYVSWTHRGWQGGLVLIAFLAANAALNTGFFASSFFGSGWQAEALAAEASDLSTLASLKEEQARIQAQRAAQAASALEREQESGWGDRSRNFASANLEALERQEATFASLVESREQATRLLSEGRDLSTQASPVVNLVRTSVPEQYRVWCWVPLIALFVLALDPLAAWLMIHGRDAVREAAKPARRPRKRKLSETEKNEIFDQLLKN